MFNQPHPSGIAVTQAGPPPPQAPPAQGRPKPSSRSVMWADCPESLSATSSPQECSGASGSDTAVEEPWQKLWQNMLRTRAEHPRPQPAWPFRGQHEPGARGELELCTLRQVRGSREAGTT